MHFKAHQLENTSVNIGYDLSGKVDKEIASGELAFGQAEDEILAKLLDTEKCPEGWWITLSKQVVIPQHVMRKITEEQLKPSQARFESRKTALDRTNSKSTADKAAMDKETLK
ncbi:hypothetical protein WISP_05748 [Willisornis vidua]|uniref:Uncharacterized protein n=1 Tax=Willisornis vidua TaxID=1566151 RepID=A0ABQ9DTN6_9PASS|nr:hypothetical protein WISP_05748 [Willisornis vidua]